MLSPGLRRSLLHECPWMRALSPVLTTIRLCINALHAVPEADEHRRFTWK
jgi:hypothetical protein